MLKFYRYPNGQNVYIGSHNKDVVGWSKTVYINGKKITLRNEIMVFGDIATVEERNVEVVDRYYENANGDRITTSAFEEMLGAYKDGDGDWLDLDAEYAGRKLQGEWEFRLVKETRTQPVAFEIIELETTCNKWMVPMRHAFDTQITMFQLNRMGFVKDLARELCEGAGLEWGDGYEWSDHSGLRFWKIEGKYIGSSDLALDKRAFYGTASECAAELDRLEKLVRHKFNRHVKRHMKVAGAPVILDELEKIYNKLLSIEVYKKYRSEERAIRAELRAVCNTLEAQINNT